MKNEEMLTRKEFFKAFFTKGGETVASILDGYHSTVKTTIQSVQEPKIKPDLSTNYVRPPGALPEKEFLVACTQCDDCLKACPHWVIRKAGPELGEKISGTPIVVPHENPCLFCTDLPCIKACDTGALTLPAKGDFLRIGTAIVEESKCYVAKGQPCDYCQKHCPTNPKAIQINGWGNLPQVDLDICTGCGKCAQICPGKAIKIH